MDVEELEKIIGILKGTEVTQLELERDGTILRICRSEVGQNVPSNSAGRPVEPAIHSVEFRSEAVEPGAEEDTSGLTRVESPIVGTFYRKPSPDSETFADVGQRVVKGQTICIVEAMKLMNEIEAPVSGIVEKILLQDGQVEEYGELLFLIRAD